MTRVTAARRTRRTSRLSNRRFELGRRAEDAAAEFLVAAGYTLLWRNLRLGALELDIVAQRGDLVIIVEVRTRGAGSLVGPLESITPTKRDRLRRAARRLWKERLAIRRDVMRVRLDVIAVTFDGETTAVEHVEGAIDARSRGVR